MNASREHSLVRAAVDGGYDKRNKANSFKWCVVNGVLLAVFACDLWHKCPGHTSWLHYAELVLAATFCASLLHHLRRCAPRSLPPPPARPAPRPPRASTPPPACLAPRASPPTPPRASPPPAQPLATPPTPPPPASYRLACVTAPTARREERPEPPRADDNLAEHARALRLWLHLTVLRPLATRLDEVDRRLRRHRASLADAGAERLRALAPLEPALAETLPYLEALPERARGARRVRELAADGGLSAYRWREDAEPLLRVLAVYAGARLGGDWGARLGGTGGRAPRLERAGGGTDAPHFAVRVREGAPALSVPRGRDNLLHAVLLTLRACCREGALQRAQLGPAGLNLLWVLGD